MTHQTFQNSRADATTLNIWRFVLSIYFPISTSVKYFILFSLEIKIHEKKNDLLTARTQWWVDGIKWKKHIHILIRYTTASLTTVRKYIARKSTSKNTSPQTNKISRALMRLSDEILIWFLCQYFLFQLRHVARCQSRFHNSSQPPSNDIYLSTKKQAHTHRHRIHPNNI